MILGLNRQLHSIQCTSSWSSVSFAYWQQMQKTKRTTDGALMWPVLWLSRVSMHGTYFYLGSKSHMMPALKLVLSQPLFIPMNWKSRGAAHNGASVVSKDWSACLPNPMRLASTTLHYWKLASASLQYWIFPDPSLGQTQQGSANDPPSSDCTDHGAQPSHQFLRHKRHGISGINAIY